MLGIVYNQMWWNKEEKYLGNMSSIFCKCKHLCQLTWKQKSQVHYSATSHSFLFDGLWSTSLKRFHWAGWPSTNWGYWFTQACPNLHWDNFLCYVLGVTLYWELSFFQLVNLVTGSCYYKHHEPGLSHCLSWRDRGRCPCLHRKAKRPLLLDACPSSLGQVLRSAAQLMRYAALAALTQRISYGIRSQKSFNRSRDKNCIATLVFSCTVHLL